MMRTVGLALVAIVAILTGRAEAAIRITEWMYQGDSGEFIEFTNIGSTPIDLAGWSFSDSETPAGTVPLGGLGVVAAGESFIIADLPASTFRTAWALSPSVKVLGDNLTNLGRTDAINIYDGTSLLVDQLAYSDQNFPGSPRTQNRSGIPTSSAALGANDPTQWILATNGDAYGSWLSAQGSQGSPGFYNIPEPAALTLAGLTGLALAALRRQTRR